MKTRHLVSGLLTTLLLPVSLTTFAQAVDVSACQKIEDRLARYACYDGADPQGTVAAPRREAQVQNTRSQEARVERTEEEDEEPGFFGRLFDGDDEQAESETSPQVADAGASEGSAVDNFGRSTALVRDDGDGKGELIDTVAAIEQVGPQLLLVTLASGQQWRQMLSKRYALKVGDEVRIYSTRWGSSYRLSAERLDGFVQVQRVD
ncbi:MAG: hypothetical protein RLZZ227_718 [Pseudomonadota bacterium]|jgi:hypothetical protein